jgi:hypothetical protein
MSAFKKKISVHYIQGYNNYATAKSSSSFLPIIVAHFLILASGNFLAISMTISQYSSGLLLISSLAQRNLTFSILIPSAFQTSTKYYPTTLILFRSPPILLLSRANQSATQKMKMQPASVSLLTLMALSTPWAMCILPEGSKPS